MIAQSYPLRYSPASRTYLAAGQGRAEAARHLSSPRTRPCLSAADGLVDGLTVPLPVTMIGELVGVPPEDRADFKKWSHALLVVARDEEGRRSRQAGAEALRTYFADLVAERRQTMRPELAPDAQPDLVSALLTARDEDGRLREPE